MRVFHKVIFFASLVLGALLIVGAVSLFLFSNQILEREGEALIIRIQRYLHRAEVAEVDPENGAILRLTGVDMNGALFLSQGRVYFSGEEAGPIPLSPEYLRVVDLAFEDRSASDLPHRVVFALEEKEGGWWKRLIALPNLYLEEARAIVFDSDIVPFPGSNIRVGLQAGDVTSINNTLFFAPGGASLGINTSSPNERLVIEGGGVKFTNPAARPTCDESHRGTIWFTHGNGTTEADKLSLCMRNALGTYYWSEYQGL